MAREVHRHALCLGLLPEWNNLVSFSISKSDSANNQYRNDLCMFAMHDRADDLVPSSKTHGNPEKWTAGLLFNPWTKVGVDQTGGIFEV